MKPLPRIKQRDKKKLPKMKRDDLFKGRKPLKDKASTRNNGKSNVYAVEDNSSIERLY